MFLSSCDGYLGAPLELQQGSESSFHVEAWNSAFYSSGQRGLRPPVELRCRIRDFSRVVARESNLPSCCEGNLGFHLSSCRGIRRYVDLIGNLVSFRLAAGNSGFL